MHSAIREIKKRDYIAFLLKRNWQASGQSDHHWCMICFCFPGSLLWRKVNFPPWCLVQCLAPSIPAINYHWPLHIRPPSSPDWGLNCVWLAAHQEKVLIHFLRWLIRCGILYFILSMQERVGSLHISRRILSSSSVEPWGWVLCLSDVECEVGGGQQCVCLSCVSG